MTSPLELVLECYPTLARGRRYALARLAELRERFGAEAAGFEQILTIALGGSLGRLEAHPDSDLDCLIVARADADGRQLASEVARALEILDGIGLKAAKSAGIYRRPVDAAALTDPTQHGSLAEPAEVFGSRMQLLLDARAVLHEASFATLRRAVVEWYGDHFLEADPRRGWTSLSNDIGRYLHAYAGWQQFKFEADAGDNWHLRQAKLRSTRLITFAGLMFLLGHSNARADKRAWLLERLPLTPIGRLSEIMCRYDANAFKRLLDAYEATQAAMADTAHRRALLSRDTAPGAIEQREPYEVVEAERTLSRILTQFLLERSNDWDPRFFERVLF